MKDEFVIVTKCAGKLGRYRDEFFLLQCQRDYEPLLRT
jgi:hypothetical protein